MNEIERKLKELVEQTPHCSLNWIDQPDMGFYEAYEFIPDELLEVWPMLSYESRMVALLAVAPHFARYGLG
jgi:hypothetical protein